MFQNDAPKEQKKSLTQRFNDACREGWHIVGMVKKLRLKDFKLTKGELRQIWRNTKQDWKAKPLKETFILAFLTVFPYPGIPVGFYAIYRTLKYQTQRAINDNQPKENAPQPATAEPFAGKTTFTPRLPKNSL